MSFWEDDLTYVFNDFGVSATFGASTISVLFFNEFQAANLLNISVETRNPYLIAKDADVPGVTQSSTFVINSVTYYVLSVQPDGTGVSLIQISKTSP